MKRHLLHKGKRLKHQNKYVVKGEVLPIPGQIDMISGTDGVVFSSFPDVTGYKTIKWKAFLTNPTSIFGIYFQQPSVNDFVYFSHSYIPEQGGYNLCIQTRNNPYIVREFYDVSGYIGQVMKIEVMKTDSGINIVKVNNIVLTKTGTGNYDFVAGSIFKKINGTNHSSIWNLEIVGTHKWIGCPDGNTDGAWIDTIGTIDGIIAGTPGTVDVG